MTIYLDNAGIQATVHDIATGRSYTSRWCHLFSSDINQTELHRFAARIGLRRAWFQPGERLGRPGEHDPAADHYDLTANKRRHAITAGATAVDLEQAVALWNATRDLVHEQQGGTSGAGQCPRHSGRAGDPVVASRVIPPPVPAALWTARRSAEREGASADEPDPATRGETSPVPGSLTGSHPPGRAGTPAVPAGPPSRPC